MTSYIHLIRHGLTEGNEKHWYYGQSNISLTHEGIEELKELEKLNIYPKGENPDYYTSQLIRTEQTLYLIYGQQEHRCLASLNEMCFGEFEKKSHEDLKNNPSYCKWIKTKDHNCSPPGGESVNQFITRIKNAKNELISYHRLKELSVRHNKKDAVSIAVSHGGVIGVMLMDSFPNLKKSYFNWIPNPGHGYTLKLEHGQVIDFDKF